MFEKANLNKIIDNMSNKKILVIGDFAIDEMIYGNTSRISREAPVLILLHSETKTLLGAASNAAHNLSTLNQGQVGAIGVYGDDYHGPILLETLNKAGVNTNFMVKDSSRPTTVKTRISGASTQSVTQQIIRIDRESHKFVSDTIETKIIENIKKALPNYDAVILSDYGTGMMTQNIINATIETANSLDKIIAVDPQTDLHRFQKSTVLTPNQPDAQNAVDYEIKDETTLNQAGADLLAKTNAKMLLITRGGDGMIVFEKDKKGIKIPAFNKTAVFDVTGAGDTVVASFTLALAAGATPAEAMLIGNLAASIVVKQFGCATTTQEELKSKLKELNIESI
ncbi:MAG: PfkB family carbohydrate kinase [bacterium]